VSIRPGNDGDLEEHVVQVVTATRGRSHKVPRASAIPPLRQSAPSFTLWRLPQGNQVFSERGDPLGSTTTGRDCDHARRAGHNANEPTESDCIKTNTTAAAQEGGTQHPLPDARPGHCSVCSQFGLLLLFFLVAASSDLLAVRGDGDLPRLSVRHLQNHFVVVQLQILARD
jgi:hypothetical protein